MQIVRLAIPEVMENWPLVGRLAAEYGGADLDELLKLQLDIISESAVVLVAADEETAVKEELAELAKAVESGVLVSNIKAMLIGRMIKRGINDKGSMLIYVLTSFTVLSANEWMELWKLLVEALQRSRFERVELYTDNVAVVKILKNVSKHHSMDMKLFCSINL